MQLTYEFLGILIINNRGTETKEQIELRLRNAELEIKRAEDSKLFGKILVNEEFDETSKAFFRYGTLKCMP